jgi:hypothetical protein
VRTQGSAMVAASRCTSRPQKYNEAANAVVLLEIPTAFATMNRSDATRVLKRHRSAPVDWF